jgi:hypothetical protein
MYIVVKFGKPEVLTFGKRCPQFQTEVDFLLTEMRHLSYWVGGFGGAAGEKRHKM